MTVNYNQEVSSVNSFTFVKLLMTWRGSIWKSVRWELTMWVIAFAVVQMVYRYLMTEDQQKFFEYSAIHLNVRLIHIPLTFMLGFFVTIVVDRWRSVFTNIGFIENVALSVGTLVAGTDHAAKVLRRTIIRYLVLSQVLVLRDISMRVRRRFPTMESLVSGGFLYRDELERMYKCDTMYNKYWLPTHWANQLVHKAMFETKNVDSVQSMNSVLMNIKEFRQSMEMLTKYDWVPIPIAYPQVVFLAVRVYFIICLVSRQYLLSAPPTEAQSIVPIMTILQFVFFVGWMKVAEALLNPLGEDDDDFECNWLIDRNMSTGIEIVDTCHDSCPPLKLDEPDDESGTMYWCHPTKNGSQAPPSAVAISQHKNPFTKVLNMVHPFSSGTSSNSSSFRQDPPN
ncbi:Bestrophin homolog [Caenorhabditis elegans]|uniref:Bestrophin homolog n=1 Tax=Caenorhabditis elegans TaxID=6239 RepID=Q9NA59_CAEEL|nr:Bestrophin homolog [Caenorhabditis elegans]CAB60536.2 Bestrophin homolog [Caenorhabditis elegans]|eukprot:NP_502846.2 Bestrophin homolog [Caenorhabditis elegans]